MIFTEKKSALVRLSDAIKMGLCSSAQVSEEVLAVFEPHREAFHAARLLASKLENARDSETLDIHQEIERVLAAVPQDVSLRGVALQSELHSRALTTVLLSCFCLESYVNSLAYHLFRETDLLGLVRGGYHSSAELLLDAIERMSTREKWRTLSQLKGAPGFDKSAAPFQDFIILFNFRDDHVHDKVVDHTDERVRKRYNNKFPDPVIGLLALSHALYAAETYWQMVNKIHASLRTDASAFHRHYNLAPWVDEQDRARLETLAKNYDSKLGPNAA